MSIVQSPIMGQMRKSYANVNTYVYKGQNVVSAKAFNRKDANTEAQKAHRTGFRLISDVWNSLGGYSEYGFPVRAVKQSAYNVFMQLNLPAAIDNSGEVPVIDYSLLQIAKGTLPGVENVMAVITADGITVTGNTLSDYPKAIANDVITVLVKKAKSAVKVIRQPRGTEAEFTTQFVMPDIMASDIEFVYVFTNSADGKKASNSVFVLPE